jgi:hypothetical protein
MKSAEEVLGSTEIGRTPSAVIICCYGRMSLESASFFGSICLYMSVNLDYL